MYYSAYQKKNQMISLSTLSISVNINLDEYQKRTKSIQNCISNLKFLSDGKNYSISDHPIQPINCLKGLKASFFVSLRSVKLLIEFFFQSSLLTKNVVIHLKCWSIILKRESWKNNRNSISIKEILAKNNPITTFLPVPFDAMSSYTIWSIKHSIQ